MHETNADKCWEVNENGERVIYNKSPYYVAEVKGEKRYLLRSNNESLSTEYIPAIPTGIGYLNLISMDEMSIANQDLAKEQATMYISFIAKKEFDL